MAAAMKLMRASFMWSHRGSLPLLSRPLQINRSHIFKCARRHLLSAAFRCDQAWRERLTEPALKDVKPGAFFVELDRKFYGDQSSVSAIDLDLFANSDIGHEDLANLEDAIQRFRRTPATIDLLPSTAHAVVRHFLHFGQHRVLMRILDKRPHYGIFPDDYCVSLVMDTFIKQKNFRDATKIAIEMMLQEDMGSPIAQHLALYSCLCYLQSPQPEPWETEPPPPPQEEPPEQIVIRLTYLPPVYFDDHFDLKDPMKLIGKTLAVLGKQFDGELGRTCMLIGYGLYGKWGKVEQVCVDALQNKNGSAVFKEGVTRVRQVIENIAVDDEKGTRETLTDKISPLLDQVESAAVSGHMLNLAKELTEKVVKQHEQSAVEEQTALYQRWAQVRVDEVQRQADAFSRLKRIKAIAEIKEDLKKREQLLFFFENFEIHAMNVDRYDAMVAQIEEAKMKRLTSPTKVDDVDETYVPPDVRHKPNKRT